MEKSDAIVLRTIEFSETSLIVTLLTREFGKLGAIAKGARRPKGPFESALNLLSVCRIVVIRKANDNLDLLTEAKLERRFRATELPGLTQEQRLNRLYAGYYIAEMLRVWTDDGDPHPDLYDATLQTLKRIDGDAPLGASVLAFELRAIHLLGHGPRTDSCVDCSAPMDYLSPNFDQKTVTFGLLEGGVLCDRCSPNHHQTVVCSPNALQALQKGLCLEGIPPETFTPANYSELRPLVSRYIVTMLGFVPRMSRFLPTAVDV